MKISTRLKLLGVLSIVAAVAVIGLQHERNATLADELADMTESRRQIGLVVAFERSFDQHLELVISGAPAAHIATRATATHQALADLNEIVAEENHPAEQWALAELEGLVAVLDQHALSSSPDLQMVEQTRDLGVAIVRGLLQHEQEQITDASVSAADTESTTLVMSILAAGVLGLLLLVGIVAPIRRFMLGMIETTRRIANGDLKTPVQLRGPADLSELGVALDQMRVELHDKLGIEARIHETEQFTRALRASEDRYRTLFDVSPLPTWVIDSETRQLRATNRALVDMSGYSAEELEAMRVDDLLDGDSKVVRLSSKSGGVFELDVTSHTILTDQGVCTLSVGVDVTEARRVEEQLRQAQKMEAIGQLAGGVAHDFNNILAVIQMNAELLASDLGADHASAEDVREIAIASERGARLTRQLLAFSRKQVIASRPVAINAVVADLEKMLSRVVGENIEISTSQSSRAGVVHADPGQLEQVVMNLVVNARDAMPDGGRLSIETGAVELSAANAAEIGVRAGRYSVITVADEGCGMDAQTKARIFEPFFTTKEVGKGTGLGLANVFGIATQNGGAVTVDSEVGAGSTFRVYFPRIGDRLTEATPVVRDTVAPSDSRTVLVVEDEAAVRVAIKRLLTSWGHHCIEAHNADVALEMLRQTQEPIDLLVTDLVMPGMNGHALATEARAVRPELKVLMMSGYTEHPSLKREVDLYGEAFVAKPFSAQSFSSAMRAALDRVEDTSAILVS